MKSFVGRFVVIAATLMVGSSWMSPASAQERFQGDLTLRNTYLKTHNGLLALNESALTPAFTPTVIDCAGGRPCTVRIGFSAVANLLEGVPSGSELSAHTTVKVDGQPQFSDDPEVVFPDHEVLLGYNSAGTSTFTWVTEVSPGEHTIEIFVRPQYGGTDVFLKARTLTIELYRARP